MIKRIISKKDVLQIEPEISDSRIVFMNFDRKTMLEEMREGDDWEIKTTSDLKKINKIGKNGREMFHMYVLPVRRIEKWFCMEGKFTLWSGINKIKEVSGIKKIVDGVEYYVNPETGDKTLVY